MVDKFLNIDCFEGIKTIEDNSVDLILEDMPYNTTACDWDVKIDLELYWKTRLRILKPTGVICLTANQPFTSELVMSNRDMFKYEWIWEKGKQTNFLNAKYRPLGEHENILLFGGGTYNPQLKQLTESGRKRLNRNHNSVFTDKESVYGNIVNLEVMKYKNKIEGYPKTIIKFNAEANNQFQKQVFHPTQKPVGLFEYLIRTYTNEGDLVFDGFAGSGTTGIACEKSNRNYIMFEKEKKYYDLAQKRLEQFRSQLKLAL